MELTWNYLTQDTDHWDDLPVCWICENCGGELETEDEPCGGCDG